MPFATYLFAFVMRSLFAMLLAIGAASPIAPQATPRLSLVTTPGSSTWLLDMIPSCSGIKTLSQQVAFPWPNIDRRKRQLLGSNWGYFTCNQPADAVSRFYRDRLPKAPYQMKEVSWVARREGTLGIFHNPYSFTWVYLWVVPQPGAPQNALLVVAQNFGSGVAFHCRLRSQPLMLIDLI